MALPKIVCVQVPIAHPPRIEYKLLSLMKIYFIRPHLSATYVVDEAYCYRPNSVVCRWV